jgi:hypothetical protein
MVSEVRVEVILNSCQTQTLAVFGVCGKVAEFRKDRFHVEGDIFAIDCTLESMNTKISQST